MSVHVSGQRRRTKAKIRTKAGARSRTRRKVKTRRRARIRRRVKTRRRTKTKDKAKEKRRHSSSVDLKRSQEMWQVETVPDILASSMFCTTCRPRHVIFEEEAACSDFRPLPRYSSGQACKRQHMKTDQRQPTLRPRARCLWSSPSLGNVKEMGIQGCLRCTRSYSTLPAATDGEMQPLP